MRAALSVALGLAVALGGCSSSRSERLHEFQFFAFGTLVEIAIWGADRDLAERAYQAIEADFTGMEADWHAWRPGALVEANRALASSQAIRVPPSIVSLVKETKTLSPASRGLFNPAIGKLIELWGFHSDDLPLAPPDPQAIAALVAQHPSMEAVAIEGAILRSENPAVQLDFGAYAKGYAVDRGIERLRGLGIHNTMLNAGGDLRAIGRHGARAWRIGIRHPRQHTVLASIELGGDESVLTSGDYERFFMYNGNRYHHIMDPRTGYPASQSIAVTVLSREAAAADAAATALFVAGPGEFEDVARGLGVDQAMLIDSQGRIHLTPRMRERLRFEIDPDAGIAL